MTLVLVFLPVSGPLAVRELGKAIVFARKDHNVGVVD